MTEPTTSTADQTAQQALDVITWCVTERSR